MISLTMTKTEVVDILRERFEGLFPKVCPNCDRCYSTLRDYILTTKRLGPTMSYDTELGDWNSLQAIGSVALVNCPCGSTLALDTSGMPVSRRRSLLN